MDRAIAIQGLVDVVSRLNSQAILIFHAADFIAAKSSSSVFRARLNNFLSSISPPSTHAPQPGSNTEAGSIKKTSGKSRKDNP
jgi:hypothetical protein